MSTTHPGSRLREVPEELRRMVAECHARRGATGAAKAIGVSRPVILAVLAGTGVTSGTLALLREYARHRQAARLGLPLASVEGVGRRGGPSC